MQSLANRFTEEKVQIRLANDCRLMQYAISEFARPCGASLPTGASGPQSKGDNRQKRHYNRVVVREKTYLLLL